jgi:hypothetical protein
VGLNALNVIRNLENSERDAKSSEEDPGELGTDVKRKRSTYLN